MKLWNSVSGSCLPIPFLSCRIKKKKLNLSLPRLVECTEGLGAGDSVVFPESELFLDKSECFRPLPPSPGECFRPLPPSPGLLLDFLAAETSERREEDSDALRDKSFSPSFSLLPTCSDFLAESDILRVLDFSLLMMLLLMVVGVWLLWSGSCELLLDLVSAAAAVPGKEGRTGFASVSDLKN